ncbi:MAG: TetR/AcrR family transcriptional regulator [Pseudomonadota bacterium]
MNDAPKPKRGRPKSLDREGTLRIAMQAYWESDPGDVSVNRICTLAGVSKPALYREFGSEDGLTHAVLDHYAEEVLSEITLILARSETLAEALAGLIHFASQDQKMQTGCVFYKMRGGKHRLGPMTRARVEEIAEGAVAGFEAFLTARRAAGDWPGAQTPKTAARYLFEQVGLALTQRAAGEPEEDIRAGLTLALTAIAPQA